MDYTKLQTDILKAAIAEDHFKKVSPFLWSDCGDDLAIMVEGFYVVFIPKTEFYLDVNKVFKNEPVKKVYNETELRYAYPAYDTQQLRYVDPKKPPLKIFKLADNVSDDEIRVNLNFFKYFGKDYEAYHYKGHGKKKPLYVYEGGETDTFQSFEHLVGILLPVNY